ncbi:unnamed protein product, partial [Allacma fusca]
INDEIKVTNLIQKCAEPSACPNISWKVYNCKVRPGVGHFDNYEKAQVAAD